MVGVGGSAVAACASKAALYGSKICGIRKELSIEGAATISMVDEEEGATSKCICPQSVG